MHSQLRNILPENVFPCSFFESTVRHTLYDLAENSFSVSILQRFILSLKQSNNSFSATDTTSDKSRNTFSKYLALAMLKRVILD